MGFVSGRRDFLKTCGLIGASVAGGGWGRALGAARDDSERKPNFVIIFADDLGYGDLGCYGHPTIRTPRLDRMAREGMKLTQFYAAASVCTPSRAGLLTGRLPIRSGMCSGRRRVLFPNSKGGLPESEVTIAGALKGAGYTSCCIGKWHLGHLPEFLPRQRGFDYYFGIPYSNDMKPTPLLENETELEEPAVQETITKRYTQKAVEFIEANREGPFFLYMAHTFPHTPLFASEEFRGVSARGLYGDVVEELDASVGAIIDALEEHRLAEDTLVLFTSDNGPWLPRLQHGGSAGLLRGGKGSTWEGGVREPSLAWWPGRIPGGSVSTELASTLDYFPTCLALAGVDVPADRVIDGYDISEVLLQNGASPRETMFYYRDEELFAVRKGPWKMHLVIQEGYGDPKPHPQDPPLLFHVEHDPSEKYNVAGRHPRVIEELKGEIEAHQATLKPVVNQLEL